MTNGDIPLKRFALLAAGALAASLPLLAAHAALPETDAVLGGAAYLKTIQGADGTYGTTDPGQNMDSIFAVRAAGYDPAKDVVNNVGPLQYFRSKVADVNSSAAAAKAALAAKALGLDPTDIDGTDLIAKLEGGFDPQTFRYSPGDDFSHSIAMVGLACTGEPVPAVASDSLQKAQLESGGWGFGGVADPDTTAIAVQALVAVGLDPGDPTLVAALAYLKDAQGNDGGWGYDVDASNASSTAFVVQALLALGEDPEGAPHTRSGVTPIEYLLSQQRADGSFAGFDPTFATNQVLPALAGRTFCNAPETPITRTRPVVVATPTATVTASPTLALPTPTTQAPRPPAAGTGPAAGSGTSGAETVAAVLLLAAGGGLALASRSRGR
jgi:hypothetical protein